MPCTRTRQAATRSTPSARRRPPTSRLSGSGPAPGRLGAHDRLREQAGGDAALGLAGALREQREAVDDSGLDVEPIELLDDRCLVFQRWDLLTGMDGTHEILGTEGAAA